ncbi:MAG: caspase family protein [Desulfobacterales bacterium]|jgi:hypothetical protein|nr:caspase family protein [Desulfobacterales bacterium]
MANKALLVGVNRYKLSRADLQGCLNDVTNVRDVLLKYFGFTVKQIRVLADGRATKKAILHRLDWLVKDAKSGDRLLFHFSGHGSQIRDRDGDELKDGLDEIICPHDMDWDGIDTHLSTDRLFKIKEILGYGWIRQHFFHCYFFSVGPIFYSFCPYVVHYIDGSF